MNIFMKCYLHILFSIVHAGNELKICYLPYTYCHSRCVHHNLPNCIFYERKCRCDVAPHSYALNTKSAAYN